MWTLSSVSSINDAPMLLTRVCRGWRDIVLQMPLLWSKLSIRIPKNHPSRWKGPELAQMWIDRAGKHLLSICVHCPEYSTPPAQLVKRLLSDLITHCNRWKEIRFHVPVCTLSALRSIPPGSVASLETFLLEDIRHPFDDHPFIIRPPDDLDFLQHAPQLRSLEFRGRIVRLTLPTVAWAPTKSADN